jgi:N6-adenosine-specific RNA methylase IME4
MTDGKFGTIIADPPWAYDATSRQDKLRGYTDLHYAPLSTDSLCQLPVGDLASDEAVLLLWTTFPFIHDAKRVIEAWGFDYVTGLAWVKANPETQAIGYGVGYWFRGAVELVLVGKRQKSYRSQYVGLISPGLKHSRKPESLHELAEATYPGPRLELFAREQRPGWTTLGNECPGDGQDIRNSLYALVNSVRTVA